MKKILLSMYPFFDKKMQNSIKHKLNDYGVKRNAVDKLYSTEQDSILQQKGKIKMLKKQEKQEKQEKQFKKLVKNEIKMLDTKAKGDTLFIPIGISSFIEFLDKPNGIDWNYIDDFFLEVLYEKCSNAKTSISFELKKLKKLLISKNKKYGNSALEPKRIFSTADTTEQICIRIDDKISRFLNQNSNEDEDVLQDLLGYIVLLKIAMVREVEVEIEKFLEDFIVKVGLNVQ